MDAVPTIFDFCTHIKSLVGHSPFLNRVLNPITFCLYKKATQIVLKKKPKQCVMAHLKKATSSLLCNNGTARGEIRVPDSKAVPQLIPNRLQILDF